MLALIEVYVLTSILGPENASVTYHYWFLCFPVLARIQGLTSDVLCSNLHFSVNFAFAMAVFRGAEEPASNNC